VEEPRFFQQLVFIPIENLRIHLLQHNVLSAQSSSIHCAKTTRREFLAYHNASWVNEELCACIDCRREGGVRFIR
jgi:hypothetical protein